MRLATERLILRPFRRGDAARFAELAGDWDVASMTSDIPFPLTATQARVWLKPGRGEVRFAVELKGRLIGGVGFYRRPSGSAELGFWLGRPWWRCGYATEAARAAVLYGFSKARVPSFSSSHFVDNPASARVLNKLGFEPVGRGRICCLARGCEVEALIYRLDRESALLRLPEATARAHERTRWRSWLGSLAGGAVSDR
jgi:RimJ/RimL family protein N-acetyltransferase